MAAETNAFILYDSRSWQTTLHTQIQEDFLHFIQNYGKNACTKFQSLGDSTVNVVLHWLLQCNLLKVTRYGDSLCVYIVWVRLRRSKDSLLAISNMTSGLLFVAPRAAAFEFRVFFEIYDFVGKVLHNFSLIIIVFVSLRLCF